MSKVKNKKVVNNSARVVRVGVNKGKGIRYLNLLPGDNVVTAGDWALAMQNKVAESYTKEGSIRGRTGKVERGVLLEVTDTEAPVTQAATKTRQPSVKSNEEKSEANKAKGESKKDAPKGK